STGCPRSRTSRAPPSWTGWPSCRPRWTSWFRRTREADAVQDEPRGPLGFDDEKVRRGVRLILEGVGEDADREGLVETPGRVADMYREVLAGLGADPIQLLTVVRGADHDEMIMIRGIPMFSLCEHHLTPFSGVAHIA